MKKFENIKSITGQVKFHGNGFINGDSKEQKFALRSLGLIDGKVYDNVTFHKKYFFEEDGVNKFKQKVSSNCLRGAMYEETMNQYNEGITELPSVLFNAISTPDMISRGYMFTNENVSLEIMPKTFKKKSCVTITDAVATDAQDRVILEVGTHRGYKYGSEKTDDEDATKGGKSLFYSENIGEHDYVSNLCIDLTECQFLSLDEVYDRGAVFFTNKAHEELFYKSMRRNFGVDTIPSKSAYYIPGAVMGEECAEEGLLFTHEMVDILVKRILSNIAKIHITRPSHSGLFNFVEMNLTINFADGSEENLTITNAEQLDDLFFGYYQKYEEANEDSIRNREELLKKMEVHNDNKTVSTGSSRGKKSSKKTDEE